MGPRRVGRPARPGADRVPGRQPGDGRETAHVAVASDDRRLHRQRSRRRRHPVCRLARRRLAGDRRGTAPSRGLRARRRSTDPVHLRVDRKSEGSRAHASLAAGALDRSEAGTGIGRVPAHVVPAAHALRPRPHLQRALPMAIRSDPIGGPAVPGAAPPAARRADRRAANHLHVVRAVAVGPCPARCRGRPAPGRLRV